ncbi:MAG TPA: hypothetical protein PKE47_13515, partial [Verrucomicrobiota bacterium]|nr:hypothetical protein [Verrucomicrobiota bacterium]
MFPAAARLCRRFAAHAAAVAGLLGPALPAARAQTTPDYELAPIEYSARPASNRITAFQARLEAARDARPAAAGPELLRWLLEALDVPAESQVLVFSKTSLQRGLISPSHPRAVYFNDDVYLGVVPGGLLEVAVTDPELGLVFYKLDPRPAGGALRFERDADCLSCHGGPMTRNWPGLLVRSVTPDPRGEPITSAGSRLVDHDTPLAERWGGWYVTGRHGDLRHPGNAVTRPGVPLDREPGANLADLGRFFDPGRHLRPDSDLVALMVLEHQAGMHNRLAEGALRTRRWKHYQLTLQRELGDPAGDLPVGTWRRVVEGETQRILEWLLFCVEAALPAGGIGGAGVFERPYQARGPFDQQGRSLRDLGLRTRIFRHRCSPLIYSEAFAALPPELHAAVLRRLDEVLAAAEPPRRFAHLPAEERRAI